MEEKFITIASLPYTRALMLQNRLEIEGIECSVENMNRIRPIVPDDVRVKVKESDVPGAMAVLEAFQNEYFQASINREVVQNFKIAKILVPVDFSSFSKATCMYALSVASKFNAEILLFHAYETPIIDTIPTEGYIPEANYALAELENNVRNQLVNFKKLIEEEIQIQNLSGVKVSSEMVFGAPTEEIVHFAREWQPNLIIMGTRGIHDPLNSFLGSVTFKVIEDARVPVIVVPFTEGQFTFGAGRNIAFATNFDESDFAAIAQMFRILEPLDMNVHFVHIENQPNRWDKLKMYGLREYIKRKYHKNAECNLIRNDSLVAGLDSFIHKKEISLLVLVTHKRSFFTRLFKPGKTKEILFYANTPLLVFHDKQ
jgi:nucleotide-binding universal stress UspA family protein